MNDKFVLPRRTYTSTARCPVIRVSRKTYDAAVELASESGLSLAAVIGKSLEFAMAHLVYIDEIRVEEEAEK